MKALLGRRKFIVDVFGCLFIVGVGGFVSEIYQLDPIVGVVDQSVLVGFAEGVFGGVDDDALLLFEISLKSFPGKIEAKFEPLDGGITSNVGFGLG